jgi:hypothetical protein
MTLPRTGLPRGRVGLIFSSVVLLVADGAQVLRLVGVMVGTSLSLRLFLRAKGLLKNPLFFDKSSTGLGSGIGDWGIGLPGDAEPLGGSMLEKEVGFE